MAQYIDKDALVVEIERRIKEHHSGYLVCLKDMLSFIDTLKVIDPYEQWIQYPSIEIGIKAHAEDYSWNIESELFQQLTPEQQKLWRKEIEQACISGGYSGFNLAKDPRYEENLEAKEVDLEKEINDYFITVDLYEGEKITENTFRKIAKHFFELGLKAQK